MKRIAIFCDGTWNDEEDHTNVRRLFDLVAAVGGDGQAQLAKYIAGVGTKPFQRILGGAVGRGLSENVREAYDFLVEQYVDGDAIFLFGFSRGAYTARSIGGLIATCGLRRADAPFSTGWVYERYRERKDKAEPIYRLEFIRQSGRRPLTADEERLLTHSRRVDIHMIGVWDTVGALGIPWTGMPLIGKQAFYFHNPNLSTIYSHAFQALAIDEQRRAYKPTLWTKFVPAADGETAVAAPGMPTLAACEQRWFAGAHSNVGGGYKNDPLPVRPMAWLQEKAAELGLAFSRTVVLTDEDYGTAPVDSYGKFMLHLYRVVTLGRRYFRPIGIRRNRVKGGWSYPVNETIDASVFERCRRSPTYAKENLRDWEKRAGIGTLPSLKGVQRGWG